ncbi:MAG: NAD(P)H-hydrate dehydratase [bacterium]|nr:NAD(P)H-hydrate dehydratase [bacterium]
MDWILSVEEMQACDRRASGELGLPSVCLMENAGRGCAEAILDHLEESGGTHVTVCCGGGNNGGDGYVAARCLANAGIAVRVLSTVRGDQLKGDAAVMRGVAERMGLEIIDLDPEGDLPELRDTDLLVDALLGSGSTGAPRGLIQRLIAAIGDLDLPVWSIDLPSGVEADSGEVPGVVIQAAQTLTMAAPKRGLLLPPGRDFAGEVTVVDIGYSVEQLLEGEPWARADGHEIAALVPPRAPSAHKGDFGKVVLLAGSPGMAGAALLCAKAVLRCGAGLARLASDEETIRQIAGHMPEVMTLPLPAESGKKRLERLLKALEWADVLALGPGLGRAEETRSLVRDLVLHAPVPVILDADGLDAFRGQLELLGEVEADLCLTPHAAEFDRLTGGDPSLSPFRRVLAARELAARHELTLVLKGAPTVVCYSTGDILINRTGSHALATGGAGDVLTGMIAGLAAQGVELDQAALLACDLHGLSGDLAAAELGAHSVISPDLLRYIPAALRHLEQGDGRSAHGSGAGSHSHEGCDCATHHHQGDAA